MTRLGDLCDFRYGRSLPETVRRPGRIPVYGSNGVVGTHDEAITDGQAIIVGRKGSVGAVHLSAAACWPIDTTYFIDRSATEVDLSWLGRALATLRLPELNKAAAVPGMARSDAYELKLFVPRMDEQRRIAVILDQAEDLRRKRRSTLGYLSNLTLALLRSTLASCIDAERVCLGSLAQIGTGATPSRQVDAYYVGTTPWVKTAEVAIGGNVDRTEECVSEEAISAARLSIYPAESILVAMYGQGTTRGRVARLGVPATVNQACAVIMPNSSYETSFVLHQLVTSYEALRALGRGGNQPNLNLELIKDFEIWLPPLTEQRHFAARAAEIDKLKATHRAHLASLDALFAALQHRAFRGEL